MLKPEYLDHIADDLLELYNQLDASIMRDIARRLVKTGNVTDTAAWQFDRLKESGLLYDDVVAQVARYANATDRQIKALFEKAGMVSTDAEISAYAKAGIKARSIRMSPSALEILKAGIQKTGGELHNLTLTIAITTQQAYINASALAEMQVESGFLDYQTAVRRAIQEASRSGVSVSYPSGHVDKLDVAVRRSVLTGVNQTMGQVSLQYADEFGCDIMELTAHAGARPSHAAWQGQLVSRSGRKGYLSLSDIGYGTGAGFLGWNCRHSWNPFFEGISTRNYTPERLQALNEKRVEYNGEKYTDYEISQLQRKMEREIRATKRELAALDEAKKAAKDEALENGLQADFSKASVKLKGQERALKDFLRETGSLPDSSRVQGQGFGRSQAQKAVWAEKKTHIASKSSKVTNVTAEYLKNATPGKGTITFEVGYKKGGHQNEIEIANWLRDTFGGDVKLLAESLEQGVNKPDYLWRGKQWDLKTTTTEKAADSAIRHGLKQIQDIPGGIILNYGDNNIDFAVLKEVIDSRMRHSNLRIVDIMIRQNGNLVEVLRYKK